MMVLASHHVVKDILDALEAEDAKKLRELASKFAERYSKDEELLGIISGEESLVEGFILARDEESKKKLFDALHELWNVRQIEGSGGEGLWFKDRRP